MKVCCYDCRRMLDGKRAIRVGRPAPWDGDQVMFEYVCKSCDRKAKKGGAR